MPDVREEIPTPDVARYHPHLQELTDHIPPLDPESDILLLIGRDLIEAHHVHDQKIGPRGSPYAQRLSLGWVIIGETCLGKSHRTDSVSVKKTYVLKNGRPSLFEPCKNEFVVHETGLKQNTLGASVFERTKDDVNIGLSVEDREFLSLMDKELHKGPSGKWVAPLPFRPSRPTLPNNRSVALKRAKSLHASMQKDSKKKTHMFTFMQKIFDNGHAELAPSLNAGEECWYLPIFGVWFKHILFHDYLQHRHTYINYKKTHLKKDKNGSKIAYFVLHLFGVYHPKIPDQIRGVFDSSAQCEGVSLNSVLLTGPDLTNSLLGILLRFRREQVAITADIEQMFYCFSVREDHRNYLRFLWYKDNDHNNELTEHRMTVHVFGNSPSPAIATYGLHRTAAESKVLFGEDVDTFVKQDFYVDDGITSVPTAEEAIDLMQRTKKALEANGRLHLHKIASNVPEVLNAFPDEDLSKSLKGLDFQDDNLPLQHSLGLNWDLQSDCFTFTVSKDAKPFTRRGILSVVNSIFDPLGFVAPVTLQGKFYLRRFVSGTVNWDDPLPEEYRQEWEDWRSSLMDLENLKIPRCYSTVSYTKSTKKTVHVYCDASEKAISAVAYLVTMDADQNPHVGFLLGKTKVAPPHGHTIPRLELCAAVLAVEIAETIVNQLGLTLADVQYHTDSRVVLGYINNKTRRFYVYVSNRVERIHRSSHREQWSYISTEANPADSGTRCLHAGAMQKSTWLLGPTQLHMPFSDEDCQGDFPLVNPHNINEVRPTVKSMKVTVQCDSSLSSRFEKFSSWRRLVEAVAFLQRKARLLKQKSCAASSAHMSRTVESFKQTEDFVIKKVQHEQFGREIICLEDGLPLLKNSRLLALNPFVDGSGIVRVGGRLNKADIPSNQKNPIILPGNHHVSRLLVGHHHEKVKHQGKHFTEGAVRAAGLWIIGGKRLVSSIIHKCVICRKLRGRQMLQQMADLPADRLQPGPPFTSVGVDAFGPWNIVTRRTRGGQANSKRWAIIFTCLTTRAIHIEVVEEMSSSSFINSLRRFVAIRGSVKSFRSDRGTNFVGATDSLKIDAINVEEGKVKAFLYNSGTVWIFNPPHSSHMGGVWERMIGVARRILDSLLLGQHGSHLTHEVLTTLMAEVCAIVNSRPLLPVSSDPDCPQILSPSSLLTQKFDPVVEPLLDFDPQNMYKAQWQRVQTLADMFWSRWQHDYLQTLQRRHKWQSPESNLKSGDVVLLQDDETSRGEWPMAIVVNAIKSEDGKVRKAEVRVSKEGKPFTYTRPICKLIQLISD